MKLRRKKKQRNDECYATVFNTPSIGDVTMSNFSTNVARLKRPTKRKVTKK